MFASWLVHSRVSYAYRGLRSSFLRSTVTCWKTSEGRILQDTQILGSGVKFKKSVASQCSLVQAISAASREYGGGVTSLACTLNFGVFSSRLHGQMKIR